MKGAITIASEELTDLLQADGGFEVVARLREAHALEIQQRLLSNLGRVGLIAAMPATFPVLLEAFIIGKDRRLKKLRVEGLEHKEAVCFAGRSGDGPEWQLVLCEDICEGICSALENAPDEDFHEEARQLRASLVQSHALQITLTRGIPLPKPSSDKYKVILHYEGQSQRPVGFVRRSKVTLEGQTFTDPIARAGIILAVRDLS